MRGARRYLVGLTTAGLVLGTVATGAGVSAASPASPPFSDIGGSTCQGAITFLASIGAVNGVGGGLFDPTAPITRAEFAKVVVNLIGQGNVAAALANETPNFVDASKIPTWAWGYVNVAADDGIIKGYPVRGSTRTAFGPKQQITDVEAAAMLIRAIGDDSQAPGQWPGNYVAAAFNLGLNSGVNFVANLPATRCDIAQLAWNAAVNVPVYTVTTTVVNGQTVSTATAGPALYLGKPVAGFQAYTGTVSGVSNSSVTITVNGKANTFSWASNVQLVGATSFSQLLSGTVTLVVNTSTSQAVYASLSSGATTNTGTLADSSTAVPSGYYALNNGGATPWIVSNDPVCAYNSRSGPVAATSSGSCSYFLLLGGSTPSTVALATYVSSASGTEFEVNPSPDGSDLGIVSGASVLTADDTVHYTLNSSRQATVVSETNVNDQIGVVTSTACASGCDTATTPGQPQTITLRIDGASNTSVPSTDANYKTSNFVVTVQPYTTITVNGSAATLSKSLDNDVAYVAVAGGYGTGTGQANPGTGDGNAVTVSLYSNQVTGTVTAITTSTSAPNAGGANPQNIASFTLQPSTGSAVTYQADANFSGSLNVGVQATIVLDSAGQARAVISSQPPSAYLAALITGTGTQQTYVNGVTTTTNTITVSDSNGSETFTLAHGVTNQAGIFSSAAVGQLTDGTALILASGSVAQAVYTATYVAPVPGDHWQIVSVTSSSAVLAQVNSSGNTDFVGTHNNPYLVVVLGNGFKASNGSSVGLGGLIVGDTAAPYSSTPPGGQAVYYDVIDTGQ